MTYTAGVRRQMIRELFSAEVARGVSTYPRDSRY
jgi:hypothetical protein